MYLGETPNAFVNRLRVERAAWMLRHKRARSITAIALDCGFSSSAAFSRAFKRAFDISPTEWRRAKDRKICKTDRKEWKDKFDPGSYRSLVSRKEADQQAESRQWDVTIKRMPRFHVAYVANLQGLSSSKYPQHSAFKRVTQLIHRDNRVQGFLSRLRAPDGL